MIRGTTPRVRIRANGLDLQRVSRLYVTFKQGEAVVEKTGEDINVQNGYINVTLTQADTLAFKGDSRVRIQLRALCSDGSALASSKASVYMEDILKDGEI